ncbi:MAG TPA: nodulation protein NfeD [Spirochaetota bacterium]|nr:nodulation protein NfeD [Spirochaetota bacterium]HPC42670.1 nodulation protein NfeD [Spirochaetota bacterium]HPL17918.1 nodulation protein NfeD [Spirochaetota bacterium]HQF07861.1 nodulation protein NfeD [Spirochaetota bacterium]HQH96914.1 nodulation protein NfeD [Spirochaetota bacterium]
MKRLILFLSALALLSGTLSAKDRYAVLTLEGSVNPIMSQYLVEAMKSAQKDGARFIVIKLDTPGGMVDSMREINKAIMASEAPVVVYTYPRGAQAASAGGYIMLAAHVAVMAPGTEIGAMHPVSPMLDFMPRDEKGDPSGVMEKKVLNDMTAYAKSLAQKRSRNTAWAERAVKEAVSSTYLEAEREKVIDFVAEDMADLLKKLDGRAVNINEKNVVVRTGGCVAADYPMDWKQRFLNFFADPQVVLFLLIIAIVGIGFEIKSPGLIAPGVIGALSLFLFFMAMRILPVNAAGIVLIALAVVLFILELKITSYGLLTIGGIAAFVFGSMILFDSPLPGGSVPMTTILAMVVVLLAFMFIVVRAVINVHRTQVTTGREGIIGETGLAMEDFDAEGRGLVKVHGEIWKAVSGDAVKNGEGIVVTDLEGITLKVEKK